MPILSIPLQILLGMAVGLLCGTIHFISLHNTVRWLSSGMYSRAILLQCLRLGLLAIVFFILVKIGATALLSGAAGLLIARYFIIKRAKRM